MASLQVANYIFYNIPIKFRKALSKLKCSGHCLNVGVGRHNSIEYLERICYLCDKQELEDDFHFVIKCPVDKNLRDVYLPAVDSDRSTVHSFYSLVKCNGDEIIIKSLDPLRAKKHS